MKKILTTTVAIIALSIGTITASAATHKPKVKNKKKPVIVKKNGWRNKNRAPLYEGTYNRRGVYTYTTTEIVYKRYAKYRNTYLHKVFRNGRKRTKLISSVRIPHVYPVKVRYRKKVVWLGNHQYLITYKITRFSNGNVTKVVHSRKPIRHKRHW